jgi:hypothetical protein
MAIPISTRLLPNALLAVSCLLVGLTAGFVTGCLWHAERLHVTHIAVYVFFALAAFCTWQVWHKGTYSRTLKRLTFWSPRLLAVVLGGLLVLGLGAGGAISFVVHANGEHLTLVSHRLLAQSPP